MLGQNPGNIISRLSPSIDSHFVLSQTSLPLSTWVVRPSWPIMFPKSWSLITPYLLFSCLTYLMGAILFGL